MLTLPSQGAFAQDFITLRSTLLQGRPPKSVNMFWRRYPMSSIPLDDAKEFSIWLSLRWKEKDELLECFHKTGRFPADGAATAEKTRPYIETEVRLVKWYEVGQIFVVLATLALVLNVITRFFELILVPLWR